MESLSLSLSARPPAAGFVTTGKIDKGARELNSTASFLEKGGKAEADCRSTREPLVRTDVHLPREW